MRKSSNVLSKTSEDKIAKFLNYIIDIIDDDFYNKFISTIKFDVKNIKDCSEKSIVDFYIETCKDLLEDIADIHGKDFWDKLKEKTRLKLVQKYVPKKTFDNTIDIYFNDVKREYIMHPMNESEYLEFIPENKDIFIKNNLKLVIDCAKRYQGLGLPLEDLIQTGNLGLMIAFEKFDTDRANLRHNILKSIQEFNKDEFTYNEAVKVIHDNFKYSKLLDATLMKIPKEGFESKDDFVEWTNINIKKASFSSIGFAWIRATITSSLNRLANVIHIPKSAKDKGVQAASIIRLDSINPHTNDNYTDNTMFETASEEFAVEDENIENIERKNLLKELTEKLLVTLQPIDRRIIKKRFGIDYPFELSIQEIAENEGISVNKVKYSINNTLKIIVTITPLNTFSYIPSTSILINPIFDILKLSNVTAFCICSLSL